MDTNKLKKFAQDARKQLIAQVGAKLSLALVEGSAARRETLGAVQELESQIHATSKEQVIEKVAYTWFNRFTALRFMDANGYTNPRVVTPADGQTRPEILADTTAGQMVDAIPEATSAAIAALLDGRTPSRDAQGEAYRLILVAACNHWHGAMPFMFEMIADYSELLMPEDLLSPDSILVRLRAVMTDDDCQDVEIIGWLYQFYISEKKDKVFADLKKNVKITAENIPAATQLFTPHWIVRYLVENSLGRLWLLNRPQSKLAAQMDYYIEPEEPETDFLRVARPEDIRICDPACGSGHMLTYAFDLLHAIYAEEGYEADRIPALILTHNLYGVEIDDRAGALAAFALVMKAAAKLGRRRFLRLGVQANICVMQDVRFTPAEMQDVAAVVGRDLFTAELRETLGQFEQAKNFGSLIVPKLRNPAEVARVVRLKDFGGDLLLRDVQQRVLKVLEMAEALSPKYHVVVANPPYMGGKGMNAKLGDYAKKAYPDSKSDLFAMFIERGLNLVRQSGISSMITIQNWMFLPSFEKMRLHLLSSSSFQNLIQIGFNTFPELNSKFALGVAFCLSRSKADTVGCYFNLNDAPHSSNKRTVFLEKRRNGGAFKVRKSEFEKIPGRPICYWVSQDLKECFSNYRSLGEVAEPRQGLATTDNDKYCRFWPEVSYFEIGRAISSREEARLSEKMWFPFNKGGGFRKWFGNNEDIVNWRDDGREIRADIVQKYPYLNGNPDFVAKNPNCYFRPGITWGAISLALSVRWDGPGFIPSNAGMKVFADNEFILANLISLLNSKVTPSLVGAMSASLNYDQGLIKRLPVIETLNAPNSDLIKTSKADWDAYETSWDFTTLPLLAPEHRDQTLAGSYARLRAHWQGMTDEMQRLEEENNRIFIDAYGLQDELTPEVPLEEITLTCNPAYRYGGRPTEVEREARLLSDTIAEFLHYAVGCMFGRYSLDVPGLILASQGEGVPDYLARVGKATFMPDQDNVIPVLDGDWFADDITDRFRKFLRVTFGEANFQENLSFIEAALGKDIRKWFSKDFFGYHLRRFKKRPIYWMFSSPNGSFNALIYMHRYRPDTVSVVLNDYLREFISKLQAERARLEKLADDTNATPSQRTRALKDVGAVTKQIGELTEWERDVVFPLAQAKIDIDLDDGVKQNYPKFGAALKPIKGLETPDE